VEENEPTVVAGEDALSKARTMAQGIPSIAGYRMERKLGEGTFGEVWLAYSQKTGIAVAIKIFKHGAGRQWQAVHEEVSALAKVSADQGIVRLIDADYHAQPPYYVMDFAEKGSLAQRLAQGTLTVSDALEFFRQTAEALAFLHEKNICHCDLKPANILLDNRSRPRIADFGQAHLSSDASPALGTFFYMAPEQATGENTPPEPRWDVYALGALFYAMVTGHPPRDDGKLRHELSATAAFTHRLKLYREHIGSAPKPTGHRHLPDMDKQLAEIVDCCLAVDPARRFDSARKVVAALDARERLRKQRTLVRYGFIAPFVILALMGVLAFWVGRDAIKDSEKALTAQILRSDLAAAKLVARIVDDQLFDRVETVMRESQDTNLLSLLRRQSESDLPVAALRPEFTNVIAEIYKKNEERGGEQQKFLRWTVASAKGYTLANWPPAMTNNRPSATANATNANRLFAWRDWFNGEKDYYDRTNDFFPPLQDIWHVSQPFFSRAGGIATQDVVAVSTPIRDPARHEVILGVLQASIGLESFHAWLRNAQFDDGFPVLINERFQIVQHPDPTSRPRKGENGPTYVSNETFGAALRGDGTTNYLDPIDQKEKLAGYAMANMTGWGALVQHEVSLARQPLNNLKRRMANTGWVVLMVVAALLALQWLLLRRVWRGKEHWLYGLLSSSRK